MADVTVGEFAKQIGVTAERLLAQIKEAGLPHTRAEDPISNDDKNTLLLFLRRSHGSTEAADAAPKKITLKRKTVETLKTSSGQGRGKTVSVEVRKKRTYVKRSELTPDQSVNDDASASEEELLEQSAELVAEKAVAESTASAGANDAGNNAADSSTERAVASPVDPVAPESSGHAASAIMQIALTADLARDKLAASPVVKPKVVAKPVRKEDGDEKDDDKKSNFRKKAVVPKKVVKPRIDEFVLEDGEFDEGGRGRRGGPRKKARLKQHGFEKPTEFIAREIIIGEANAVGDLAAKMSVKSAD